MRSYAGRREVAVGIRGNIVVHIEGLVIRGQRLAGVADLLDREGFTLGRGQQPDFTRPRTACSIGPVADHFYTARYPTDISADGRRVLASQRLGESARIDDCGIARQRDSMRRQHCHQAGYRSYDSGT